MRKLSLRERSNFSLLVAVPCFPSCTSKGSLVPTLQDSFRCSQQGFPGPPVTWSSPYPLASPLSHSPPCSFRPKNIVGSCLLTDLLFYHQSLPFRYKLVRQGPCSSQLSYGNVEHGAWNRYSVQIWMNEWMNECHVWMNKFSQWDLDMNLSNARDQVFSPCSHVYSFLLSICIH